MMQSQLSTLTETRSDQHFEFIFFWNYDKIYINQYPRKLNIITLKIEKKNLSDNDKQNQYKYQIIKGSLNIAKISISENQSHCQNHERQLKWIVW